MKEKYFNLTILQNRKGITKLRTSYKLGSVLGKWCNKISGITLCKYCGNGEIKNEIYFFFECRNYNVLRKDTFKRIIEIEEINLEIKDRLDKLRLLFSEA